MNGAERVFTALRGEKPDRIPHFEWSIVNSVIQQANIWPRLGWSFENVVELLDIDAVVAWPLYETERIDGGIIKDETGIIRQESHGDYAIAIDQDIPVKTENDLDKYQFPDPHNSVRWIQLKNLVKSFKGEKAIIMKLRDVFSWPRELLGYENLMINIALNKDFVTRVVEKCVDYSIQLATIAVDMGAEIIVTADDIANKNGLLFSPDDFRTIFLPHYRRLIQHLKELDVFVIKHTDGNIMCILDDLVEAGIDCIDPIDSGSGMSLKEVKQKYGDKVAIKGNVNCAGILDGQERDEIIEETKRCIAEGGPGGGYILSSSNSIHSGVPFSNYRLMLAILKKYGRYPLTVD